MHRYHESRSFEERRTILDRAEIRDCFDIEFLLRKGVDLPQMDAALVRTFKARLNRFRDRDFKVTLGSILEPDMRSFYISQGFSLLKERLHEIRE